jgi:hypothetical protein
MENKLGWPQDQRDIEAREKLAASVAQMTDQQIAGAEQANPCTGDKPHDVRAHVRADEILANHASRLAFELECCLFDNERFFDQACAALEAYKADVERLYPSPPTFMGEPIPAERAARFRDMRAERADKSDCHGDDWTERDGEYLK